MTLPYAGWLNAGLSLDTVRSKRSHCYLLMKKICAFQSSVPSNCSTSSKLYDQNKSWSCWKVFVYSYFFWATLGGCCRGVGKFKRLTSAPAPTFLLLLKHDVVLRGNIGWHNRSSAASILFFTLHLHLSHLSLFRSHIGYMPMLVHVRAHAMKGKSGAFLDIINSSPRCMKQTEAAFRRWHSFSSGSTPAHWIWHETLIMKKKSPLDSLIRWSYPCSRTMQHPKHTCRPHDNK